MYSELPELDKRKLLNSSLSLGGQIRTEQQT